MAELTVDMTYAQALYGACEDAGKIEVAQQELAEILEIFKAEPDFYAFFVAPTISATEKKKVLENVFKGRICDEMLHFLYILVDKKRTTRYEKIVDGFRSIMAEKEGFFAGEVLSATPLTEDQLAKLEGEVSNLMHNKVKLENRIDKSVIGGVKVFVEGKIFDASIRSRLDALASTIK